MPAQVVRLREYEADVPIMPPWFILVQLRRTLLVTNALSLDRVGMKLALHYSYVLTHPFIASLYVIYYIIFPYLSIYFYYISKYIGRLPHTAAYYLVPFPFPSDDF